MVDQLHAAPDRKIDHAIGMALRDLRERRNVSAKQLAQSAGLSAAMISRIENGQVSPSIATLSALSEALDVPIYIHPARPLPSVIDSYYGPYVDSHPALVQAAWGFGVETATHAIRLVLSGVCQEYPKLKFLIGHLGEGRHVGTPLIVVFEGVGLESAEESCGLVRSQCEAGCVRRKLRPGAAQGEEADAADQALNHGRLRRADGDGSQG